MCLAEDKFVLPFVGLVQLRCLLVTTVAFKESAHVLSFTLESSSIEIRQSVTAIGRDSILSDSFQAPNLFYLT